MSRHLRDASAATTPFAPTDEPLDLLRMASVMDEPFSIGDLAAALGRPEAGVALGVNRALENGMLIDAGIGVRFASADVRTGIADALAPSVRRSLLCAAARALASKGAPPARVARLFELGGERGDGEAIDWLIRGAHASAAASPETSVSLLRRALELCATDADRTRASIALADALTLAGRADEAADAALTALSRPHDRASELDLLTVFARARRAGGRPGDAADLLAGVLATTDGPRGAGGTRARLLSASGDALVLAGSLESGESAARAGLDLAIRTGDDDAAGEARAALARNLLWNGDVEGALELSSTAAHEALLGDDEAARADRVHLVAMHLMHADRLDEAEALFRSELTAAGSSGDARAVLALRGLGFVDFHRGRWPEARSALARAWSDGHGRGVPMDVIPSLAILAVIDVERGPLTRARTWVDEAFREVDRSGSRFSIEWPLWARALIHEAAGALAAALADARQASEAIDMTGTTYRHRVLGIELTRIAAAAGDFDLARLVAGRVTALARGAHVSTRAAAQLSCGLATTDLECLLGAVELYRRTGRVAELATALEAAGALRAERDGLGRDELVEALAIYEQMGAQRHAARVRAVLRDHGWRLGARAKRRRPTMGWESLTEAERAVAGLVAEGLTNRQIAARLFVSPRTAESHVAHLRSKLGAETRFAIAGQVRQALEADGPGGRGELNGQS